MIVVADKTTKNKTQRRRGLVSDSSDYRRQSRKFARVRMLRSLLRRVRPVLLVFALVGGVTSVIWLGQSGHLARYKEKAELYLTQQTLNMGLRVAQVEVEGLVHLGEGDVLAVLPMGEHNNEGGGEKKLDVNNIPLLAISLPAVRYRLEELGWVKSAKIERILPDRLVIKIMERKPAAIWQAGGKIYLIDVDGEVITDHGLAQFDHLPVVVGEEAGVHVQQLFHVLQNEPEIIKRLSSAIRVGNRRWDVRLKRDVTTDLVTVKLPEINVEKALKRLVEMEKENQVLQRKYMQIDLRNPNASYFRVQD